MIETSPENRRDFWKFQSAAVSFQTAEGVARRLETMATNDDIFYPLLTSLYVLYARPFRQQEPLLRIPEEMVPQDLLDLHRLLITGRDTMFAHHDRKTVKIRDGESEEYASLVMTARAGDLHAHQVFIYVAPDEIVKVTGLCSVLGQKCLHHLGELRVRCLGLSEDVPDGHYIVSSMFGGMAPLLRKCTD